MHNTQPSEDPDFDTDQDDFDFGEDQKQVHEMPHISKPRPTLHKSLLLGLFFVLIGTILGVAYRFIPKYPAPNSTPSFSPHLAPQALPNQSPPIAMPVHTPPVQPIQPTAPSPTSVQMIQPTPQSPISVQNSKLTPPQSLESSQDLEKAFEAADTISTPMKGALTESSTIPETQKALFAPKASPQPTHENTALSAELLRPLQEGLEKLHQQMDTIFGKMNYLDGYTQEMSHHLERLHQSMMTMDQRLSNANALLDQRLSNLNQTTSTLSKDVGGVKNEVSQVRETLKDEGLDRPVALSPPSHVQNQTALSMENPEYQVHAVIPGRAWLKSTKGTIMTVAEGDSLGNYGKVLVIDAAHGLVLTSSGITFR